MTTLKLDVIQVKSPCTADWAKMVGTSSSRFCSHCQKHVHDLSAIPTDEAERLLCESAGNLCVRFARDANGKVITLAYRPPQRKARSWRSWTIVALAVALVSGTVEAFLYGKGIPPFAPRKTPVGPVMYMGDIAGPIPVNTPPPSIGRSAVMGEATVTCPSPASSSTANPSKPQ